MIMNGFMQLGVFILFIFICRYLYTPEKESWFWLKSVLIYISCFLYLNILLVFVSCGIIVLIYLLNKKEILNRKLKLTVVTFGLLSFVCLIVLPNYTTYAMNAIKSEQGTLTENDKRELANTAYKYYQYLKKGDIYLALSMFPQDNNINEDFMSEILNSQNKSNTENEIQSNISADSKISVMQHLVTNKEYKILSVPSKKDLKELLIQSPNVYYYYLNLKIKYIDNEYMIGECIYMKKIDGVWKIVNIESTDRFVPYRAGIYDCYYVGN